MTRGRRPNKRRPTVPPGFEGDWSAGAAAFIQMRNAPPVKFPTAWGAPLSPDVIANLLRQAGAPVPAAGAIEQIASHLRTWQIGLAAFPKREKQDRGLDLGIFGALSEPLLAQVMEISAPELAEVIGWSDADRWPLVAEVIGRLYLHAVDPDAAFLRDGPAVKFVHLVLERFGIARSPRTIEGALSSSNSLKRDRSTTK